MSSVLVTYKLYACINFEHVQKIHFASAYNTTYTDVCQRVWNVLDMPNVPLTYSCVCERMGAYEHTLYTLMSYAVV